MLVRRKMTALIVTIIVTIIVTAIVTAIVIITLIVPGSGPESRGRRWRRYHRRTPLPGHWR